MSPSDSQTRNGKESPETTEVLDSETIVPQPKRRATAVDDDTDNGVHGDEDETLENGGDGYAWEMSDKLPVRAKEEQPKDGVGKILVNMLNMLKEACLLRCFGLFPKLPCESERVLKDASSQSREASVVPSAPESPSAFNQFPTDALEPAGFMVKYPKDVGGGANKKFSVVIPPAIAGVGRGGGGAGGGGGGAGRGRGGGRR